MIVGIYCFQDSGIKQDAMGRNPLNNEGAAAASAVLYDQASISSMTESIAASQLESEASDMVRPLYFDHF